MLHLEQNSDAVNYYAARDRELDEDFGDLSLSVDDSNTNSSQPKNLYETFSFAILWLLHLATQHRCHVVSSEHEEHCLLCLQFIRSGVSGCMHEGSMSQTAMTLMRLCLLPMLMESGTLSKALCPETQEQRSSLLKSLLYSILCGMSDELHHALSCVDDGSSKLHTLCLKTDTLPALRTVSLYLFNSSDNQYGVFESRKFSLPLFSHLHIHEQLVNEEDLSNLREVIRSIQELAVKEKSNNNNNEHHSAGFGAEGPPDPSVAICWLPEDDEVTTLDKQVCQKCVELCTAGDSSNKSNDICDQKLKAKGREYHDLAYQRRWYPNEAEALTVRLVRAAGVLKLLLTGDESELTVSKQQQHDSQIESLIFPDPAEARHEAVISAVIANCGINDDDDDDEDGDEVLLCHQSE